MDVSPNRDAVLASLSIGSRVMIRRRMSAAEVAENAGTLHEKTTLTDVVGTLETLTSSDITVRTRTTLVTVNIADIVVLKQIPATTRGRRASHRSISIAALEELSSQAWGGEQGEKMGSWLLRYAGGYTARANSCLALGEPALPLSHALDAVTSWYTSRDAAPALQLPLDRGIPAHEDPMVIEAVTHGWQQHESMAVMTAAVSLLAQHAPARENLGGVTLTWSETITPQWWALADERMLEHEESARHVLTSGHPLFVTALDGETPIARARIAIQTPWAGVFALYVDPAYRGRGLATQLMAECARRALTFGSENLYLQVVSTNTDAIRLYEKLGFSTHHIDVYLQPGATNQND